MFGARFSGAGFRGCCVALVKTESVPAVAERVSSIYAARHPELAKHARTITCESADGAGIVTVPHHGLRDTINDAYPLARVP